VTGGEWSASRPDRFTPGERASGSHWIGREPVKIFALCRNVVRPARFATEQLRIQEGLSESKCTKYVTSQLKDLQLLWASRRNLLIVVGNTAC
jgi:hypothetical protein